MANFNCRICRSDLKTEVELELANGETFRKVASKFLDRFSCDLHLLEQSIASHFKNHRSEMNASHALVPDEIELLQRLKQGTVSLDEVSRVVASKVFERILRNPDDLRFIDFFRTELLKLKQREVDDRNNWAMEFVNRMFMGKLPMNCEGCGKPLFEHSHPQLEVKESSSLYPVV